MPVFRPSTRSPGPDAVRHRPSVTRCSQPLPGSTGEPASPWRRVLGGSATRPRHTPALPPVPRRRCRPDLEDRRTDLRCRSRSSVCRQSRPRGLSTPFTLTRLPVSTMRRRRSPTSGAVGVLPRSRTGWCPCPWPPANRRLGARSDGFSLRPDSLPPREPGPSPTVGHPEVTLVRLGFPAPVGVRCPVRVATLAEAKVQVKGYF